GETTKAGAEAVGLVADLGLSDGDTITVSSANAATGVMSNYTFTVGAGSTVADLVNGINGSGFASARVDEAGVLSISTEGANSLTLSASAADADGDATLANLADDAFTALGLTSTGSLDH